MKRILGFWTVLIVCFSKSGAWSQLLDNAPPILSLERKWVISDNEPVGSVVTRVRGSDSEGDPLEYGIEQYEGYNLNFADSGPLPFTIDSNTGVVTTNQTLKGRAGQNLNLYVTVSDGKLTQKTAVWAVILDSSKTNSAGGSSGSLADPPGRPPGNVPIQLLPRPLPPRTVLLPHNFPPPPPPLPPRPSRPPTPPTNPLSSSSSSSTSNFKRTTSPPVDDDSAASQTTVSTTPPPSLPPPPPVPPYLPPIALPPAGSRPNMTDIALTVIPITMVTIAFTVVIIAAFLFRRRLCHKSKKKSAKEEVQKKSSSNGTIIEEPMMMHQWRGPRAFSNRYTAWDTDLSTPLPQHDAPSTPPAKRDDKWEYPRHHLKVFSILGEGCFGQVWKCEARQIDGEPGPTIVAVKTLKENAAESERKDLLQELQVMKMLEPHPNVVRLLGCCTEKDPIFVIMEYVPNGKLQSFLRNSRASRSYDNMHGKSHTLTSRHLTSFCYQVARGMEYLASKGIIHRDLAARNILVDTDQTCKVADFGFARDVVASLVYERKSEGRLPIRWMAPESLYDNVFSVKSDVWSFGVLIWEIVTLGSTPYPGLSAVEVMKKVKEGERLEKPEHCRRELYNIMYYCWDSQPQGRPDFTELVDLLGQLLLSETDYIELQRFPDHSYYNIVSLSGEKV